MSREFNELPDGEQRDVEQDYYDSKNDLRPRAACGDMVSVTFMGRIVSIEEDPWDKAGRLLVRIRNKIGDSVVVPEDSIVQLGAIKQDS